MLRCLSRPSPIGGSSSDNIGLWMCPVNHVGSVNVVAEVRLRDWLAVRCLILRDDVGADPAAFGHFEPLFLGPNSDAGSI